MSSPGAGHCFMSIVSVHFASKEGHWEDNQQYLILSTLKECGVCWWLVWRYTLSRQTWPFSWTSEGLKQKWATRSEAITQLSKVWEGSELRGCECGCQRKKETQQGISVTWEGRERRQRGLGLFEFELCRSREAKGKIQVTWDISMEDSHRAMHWNSRECSGPKNPSWSLLVCSYAVDMNMGPSRVRRWEMQGHIFSPESWLVLLIQLPRK